MDRRVGARVLVAGLVGFAACKGGDSLGPSGAKPPYIAVVAKIEAGSLPDPNVKFNYRVIDLSAGGVLDTTITLAPTDTLILSVRPATYEITLENLPAKCVSRYGKTDIVAVPEGTNTAISRFFITCNAPLAVSIFTQGGPDTFQFVWNLDGPGGSQQTGFVDRREQVVILNPLPPGDYIFSVYNVPVDCEVTSPGRRSQKATVKASGGSLLQFSIICSQPAGRPELKTFKWSYRDGVAALYVEAHDPDANLIGYILDLTDCAGRSLLPNGAIERGGLQSLHTSYSQNPTIAAAHQLDLSDVPGQTRCATLRLVDDFGNVTPLAERMPTPGGTFEPTVVRYNALVVGGIRLTTVLEVEDPSSMYVGAYLTLRLRDGVLGGAPDGKPDIGVYSNQGFLPGSQIPDVNFGSNRAIRSPADVQAQVVYLIDRQGRFRRLVDDDLLN